MPLLVRGPGVAAGSSNDKLTLNTDYMPTFLDLAGAQIPPYVDGRTLRPVLDGGVTTWRSAILPEAAANYSPAYEGIRTIGTVGAPAQVRRVLGRSEGALQPGYRPLRADQRLQPHRATIGSGLTPASVEGLRRKRLFHGGERTLVSVGGCEVSSCLPE
jgi:hypothetical protein